MPACSASVPRDVHHFNSLTGFGDQICVVAHNRGAQTGRPSELYFFRLPERTPSATVVLGSEAHNAWLHGAELMTCSSGDGLLLGVNGTRIETAADSPRGVCRVGGETCIGLTEFPRRPERDLSKGWIAAFDERWTRLELSGGNEGGLHRRREPDRPGERSHRARRKRIAVRFLRCRVAAGAGRGSLRLEDQVFRLPFFGAATMQPDCPTGPAVSCNRGMSLNEERRRAVEVLDSRSHGC